jgi:hypothetical protein
MRLTFQGWDASIRLEELGVAEADIPARVAAILRLAL